MVLGKTCWLLYVTLLTLPEGVISAQDTTASSIMASSSSHGPAKKLRKTEAQAATHTKISQLLHTQGCSLKALRQITNAIAKREEQVSDRQLREFSAERFNEVRRSIALPLADGTEFQWEVADPNLLVAMSLRRSEEMQALFGNVLRRHPCSPEAPWQLIVTWDEFTAGNPLKPHNSRKTMVCNMTFQELGPALKSTNCWWTVAVAKTTVLNKVVGGWSRMLRDLLKLTLCSPTGMQTIGLPLTIGDRIVTVYARTGCMLSDGDGLRLALQWMGASSLHACFRHWNVLKKDSGRAVHSAGKYVETDCHDVSKFKAWANTDLAATIDVLVDAERQCVAGAISPTRLKDMQQQLGFRATEDGLLASPELRLCIDFMGTMRYDWAHTFLADGILGAEMWALVAAGERHSLFSQDTISQFLNEEWQLPRYRRGGGRPKIADLFDAYWQQHNENAETIKGPMSELLGVYGVMRHFTEARIPADPRISAELYNFQLVCKAIDILLSVKKRRVAVRDGGRQLQVLLAKHLESHVRTSGTRRVRPKTHWAFDIAECMQQDDILVDCFVTERLHLRAKAVAEHHDRLVDYERWVMAGITNSHMNSLQSSGVATLAFDGPLAPLPGAPDILIGDFCNYFGEFFCVGDFVFRGVGRCTH